jgi:hypothetical protein
MHAMTEIDWLAGFGRLMLAVQEFERRLVIVLVVKRAFKNPEAAVAAVEKGDSGKAADRVLDDLAKLLDTDHEREFSDVP